MTILFIKLKVYSNKKIDFKKSISQKLFKYKLINLFKKEF
jgi:hypothetical protein